MGDGDTVIPALADCVTAGIMMELKEEDDRISGTWFEAARKDGGSINRGRV